MVLGVGGGGPGAALSWELRSKSTEVTAILVMWLWSLWVQEEAKNKEVRR